MTTPSPEDLVHLEENYRAAIDSVKDIVWTEEFPHYPESVVHLMCYILGSVWVSRGYDLDKATFSIEQETATLDDIRGTLTALARSERIAKGSWKRSLEDDRMRPLIDRARQILSPAISEESNESVETMAPSLLKKPLARRFNQQAIHE